MSNSHIAVADRSPTVRSRVANRPLFVRGADGRTASARRFRDIAQSLVDDLGGSVSESQMLLVRQAAMTSLQVEKLQLRSSAGETRTLSCSSGWRTPRRGRSRNSGSASKRGRGAAAPSGPGELQRYLATLNADQDDETDAEVEFAEVADENTKSRPLESSAESEHVAPAEDIAVNSDTVDGGAQ